MQGNEEEQVCAWVKDLTGQDLEPTNMQETLKSGTILCELVSLFPLFPLARVSLLPLLSLLHYFSNAPPRLPSRLELFQSLTRTTCKRANNRQVVTGHDDNDPVFFVFVLSFYFVCMYAGESSSASICKKN